MSCKGEEITVTKVQNYVPQTDIIQKYNVVIGVVNVMDKILESYKPHSRARSGGASFLVMF